MSRLLAVIQCVLFLDACSPTLHKAEQMIKPVTDSNQYYEIERLSVKPPIGIDWESINFGDTVNFSRGVMTSKEGDRNMTVVIDAFDRFSSPNFPRLVEKEFSEAARFQAEHGSVAPQGKGLWYTNQRKARLVARAGMRCLERFEVRSATTVGGTGITTTYFCEQPNQPADFPPIEVVFSESVVPGAPFSNPDTILAPIWNSLQFKPVDRATSVAYQNWKRKNAEYRARFPGR